MKKFFIANSLALLLLAGGGNALAAENSATETHVGEELVTVDGTTSSFIADTDNNDVSLLATDGAMDGGWWYRGKVGKNLVSEYKHYSKQGRGSCRNGNGTEDDGGWKKSNVWSKSSVGHTALGGNKVYYDYR